MARILISGGSSYLGQHMVPLALTEHDTSYTYLSHNPIQAPSAFQLDVCDGPAVHALVARLRPEIIIHTVGSNRPADMANVIIKGTEHVAGAAQKAGARLIHISTDALFNGQKAPYTEDDPPTPIHDYGRAKAEAEMIAGSNADLVIVRTSLIYGLQIMDRGTAWLVEALRRKQPVTLFTDQRRNPVWVQTLSLACLELATNDYRGIINVAGEQILTRAEFGLRMLDWWGIEERSCLSLGPSDHTKWPADCTYNLDRARRVLSTPLPGVDEVLRRHSENVF
jgi:dTDP-4-dehydrorhamnose reductase